MRPTRLLALTLSVSIIVLGLSSSPAAASRRGHLHARLSGSSAYPTARGHADYERMMMSGGRELDVDLWNLHALVGRTLAVYTGGTKVGSSTVHSGGSFSFHRRGSGVPSLSAGDGVAVKTTSSTLVASGTLRRVCCMSLARAG